MPTFPRHTRNALKLAQQAAKSLVWYEWSDPMADSQNRMHGYCASLFDTILISEAEGIQKPDPHVFKRAVERYSSLASETMFVGSSRNRHTRGQGRRLGSCLESSTLLAGFE